LSYNVEHTVGQTAVYNHAISALMLSEVYSTTSRERSEKIQQAIEQALQVTLGEQRRPKRRAVDHGGWRYLDQYGSQDADLSVIGWQLMFMRSAKNAGFDVPAAAIDDAVACVRRHFNQQAGSFGYTPSPSSTRGSRAMTGAGILALSHAGLHDTPEARQAGETLRGFSFARYNTADGGLDRYHYSLFQCTQAAYQLGDDYWDQFYPPTFRTLLANQNDNGSWAVENVRLHTDAMYGSVYTTALVVLSLSAPNQLLPIFQR
ncbi:MAG: prenyltransferase/squalene oxidase repeat-containing protein, partial [Bythopirellula sp.]